MFLRASQINKVFMEFNSSGNNLLQSEPTTHIRLMTIVVKMIILKTMIMMTLTITTMVLVMMVAMIMR